MLVLSSFFAIKEITRMRNFSEQRMRLLSIEQWARSSYVHVIMRNILHKSLHNKVGSLTSFFVTATYHCPVTCTSLSNHKFFSFLDKLNQEAQAAVPVSRVLFLLPVVKSILTRCAGMLTTICINMCSDRAAHGAFFPSINRIRYSALPFHIPSHIKYFTDIKQPLN